MYRIRQAVSLAPNSSGETLCRGAESRDFHFRCGEAWRSLVPRSTAGADTQVFSLLLNHFLIEPTLIHHGSSRGADCICCKYSENHALRSFTNIFR